VVFIRLLGKGRRYLAAVLRALYTLLVVAGAPERAAAVQGCTLLRTDRNDWIYLITDAEQIWVEVERRFAFLLGRKPETCFMIFLHRWGQCLI